MSKVKKRYLVGAVLIVVILLMINHNNYKVELEAQGFGFHRSTDAETNNSQAIPVRVSIDSYVNDSNLNNDIIEISYDDIKINENMLLGSKEDGVWTGFIIHFDNVNADGEILGKVVLFNKGKECFISLYNENLDIIAPVDDVEIATQKYLDFKKQHLHDGM